MAHNIFSHALAAAAESQGRAQALAHILRVPEGTLLRWLSGRAMMPVLAFSKVLELLTEHESQVPDEPAQDGAAATLTFSLNHVAARCARCQGTQFVPSTPGVTLRYRAILACKSCGIEIVHKALLLDLARLQAHQIGDTRARRLRTARPAARPEARADVGASE
jgi:hypothetical protein